MENLNEMQIFEKSTEWFFLRHLKVSVKYVSAMALK